MFNLWDVFKYLHITFSRFSLFEGREFQSSYAEHGQLATYANILSQCSLFQYLTAVTIWNVDEWSHGKHFHQSKLLCTIFAVNLQPNISILRCYPKCSECNCAHMCPRKSYIFTNAPDIIRLM